MFLLSRLSRTRSASPKAFFGGILLTEKVRQEVCIVQFWKITNVLNGKQHQLDDIDDDEEHDDKDGKLEAVAVRLFKFTLLH